MVGTNDPSDYSYMSSVAVLLNTLLTIFCPTPIEDITLRATNGAIYRLSTNPLVRPLVIVLIRTDCPLAERYAQRLRQLHDDLAKEQINLWVVNADPEATQTATDQFVRQHSLQFSIIPDPTGITAKALMANRSPQGFVLDKSKRIRYRGRIDDQYEAGGRTKAKPARDDLLAAAREVAGGKPVSVPITLATGCVIDSPSQVVNQSVTRTYHADVAPILRQHCAGCHHPGENAPFSLLTFSDAKRRAGTIADVISDGRMPPWHADRGHLRFSNERYLPDSAKTVIHDWIAQGCREGTPVELPPIAEQKTGWRLGEPDAVYSMKTPFRVPAEGLVEYQRFRIDPGLKEDAWLRAIEVRPGNRRVVHHCSVFIKPPGAPEEIERIFEIGTLGSYNLVAWTPGTAPTYFPDGMAKRIPAGWSLDLVIHYTTVGVAQDDRTEMGVLFADPRDIKREVGTRLLHIPDLVIPPQTESHTVEQSWKATKDVLLLAMLPHMHLRGKAFEYEAIYPDGTRESLLRVRAYDFNWQHRYELAEPKRLPANTTIRCVGVYDNSSANPSNPNPDVTVRTGLESSEEMFNAYFDIALADEDLSEILNPEGSSKPILVWVCVGISFSLAIGFRFLRSRQFVTANRFKMKYS